MASRPGIGLGSPEESHVTAAKRPVRHESLGLTRDDLRQMYYKMVLARALDERMWLLNRMGKAAFVISGRGQEACQIGSAWALRPGQDWVLPYYRDLAVMLVLGMTAREVMLDALGKAAGPCSGGRQMPAHWGYRRLRVPTGSSPVGTQIPHAAGIAYATKLRGESDVTVVYFGEGTTSEGDFHEGMNFAGVHRLPVIFFCENNRYAISVPLDKQMACENIADRAPGYGFPGAVVDGNDVLDVYEATRSAFARARKGDGPTLIEAKTYRVVPHSSDDNDLFYRSRAEVEAWQKKDPLERFTHDLLEAGALDGSVLKETKRRVQREVDDATEFAEQAPFPPPESLCRHVLAEE